MKILRLEVCGRKLVAEDVMKITKKSRAQKEGRRLKDKPKRVKDAVNTILNLIRDAAGLGGGSCLVNENKIKGSYAYAAEICEKLESRGFYACKMDDCGFIYVRWENYIMEFDTTQDSTPNET